MASGGGISGDIRRRLAVKMVLQFVDVLGGGTGVQDGGFGVICGDRSRRRRLLSFWSIVGVGIGGGAGAEDGSVRLVYSYYGKPGWSHYKKNNHSSLHFSTDQPLGWYYS